MAGTAVSASANALSVQTHPPQQWSNFLTRACLQVCSLGACAPVGAVHDRQRGGCYMCVCVLTDSWASPA